MLEGALARLVGSPVRLVGAGRTDAGVHATGQVISFRMTTALPETTIRRGVNALLPTDVALLEVTEVDDSFHARYSARSRTYNYMIWNGAAPRPLVRRTSLWIEDRLDVKAMEHASAELLGRHDFGAFSALADNPRSRERTVQRATWRGDAGRMLRFEIEADAFLRGMVRGIVGTLLRVGRDRIATDAFAEILRSGRREEGSAAAPAHGLCLVRVDYPPETSARSEYAEARRLEEEGREDEE